jgi:tetratricopeptide (TPR) repeat protein
VKTGIVTAYESLQDPDSPMEEQVNKAETSVERAWPHVMAWVGGITAIIGLFASVAGGVAWFVNHHKQHAETQAKLALAQAQVKQGEYPASVQTYADILKADPTDRSALNQQLHATMLWVENYHVVVSEGKSAADVSAPDLDEIFAILEAGLTRTSGSQAADVQAHLGWAHWINQHIAEREFGPAAEQNLRAALATDPSNVYANAMLGNWLLQNGGNVTEAAHFLDTAVSTGMERPFVRKMQLGGLIGLDKPGARAELVKVANDMRTSREDLDEANKKGILTSCFDPILTHHEELVESLSAVQTDDAWKTYLWLDDAQKEGLDEKMRLQVREFIQANLLEISGKRQESLEKYRALLQQLGNNGSILENSVRAAIARLSRS